MSYYIRDFGAIGDGITNDATAIQKAIDCAEINGGGKVVLSSGKTYLSGSICLKENVELHIEKGAILKASTSIYDFNYFDTSLKGLVNKSLDVPTFENCDYNGKPYQYFIYAKDVSFINISGRGRIDGSEEIYYGEMRKDQIDGAFYPRIPMIFFENCSHLSISDITILKSGFWTIHLVGCNDGEIFGVKILNNLKMANCDGIDPDHCKNIRISNCYIESADDCIVMKTTKANKKYNGCENIIITNCTLVSSSAAIKIGSESCSHFKNIIVENCIINNSNRGISFQLRDEGSIKNVIISNCIINTKPSSDCWWGHGEPISIVSIRRDNKTVNGKISDVTINNVKCIGEGCLYVIGYENNIIENLTIENVDLNLLKTSDYPIIGYDLRPTYFQGIIPRKISGIHIENVLGLYVKNINVVIDDSIRQWVDRDISYINVTYR